MLCTGTFYAEWPDEKPWFAWHIILTVICISLHFILRLKIKISEKNFKRRVENIYHQGKQINLGTNLLSWILYGIVITPGLVVADKFNRYKFNHLLHSTLL